MIYSANASIGSVWRNWPPLVTVELAAYGVHVGVLELFEDGEGTLPYLAGAVLVARVLMGVAEADEGDRFAVTVLDVPVQVDGAWILYCLAGPGEGGEWTGTRFRSGG